MLLVPLIMLANSLLLLIALRANSIKDAQTYTQLTTLLPTISGIYCCWPIKHSLTVPVSRWVMGR